MRRALSTWFAHNRRTLPWRAGGGRRDPYRVLVSEVMLQQTRVDTVIAYFEHWMHRFPTVRSLAAADDDEVLRLWQGLGYYRRALRLREAARVVARDLHGEIPSTRAGLEALPGVGRYTAAAVAALAFGDDAIAVDGNVRRVAARLLGWTALPSDGEVERRLADHLAAEPMEEGAACGTADIPLAEALIELGALVCTPRAPACGSCPFRGRCTAASLGTPESFPHPRARPAPPRRRRYALVAVDSDRVWLRRRDRGEMLGGLWGFPQSEAAPEGARCLERIAHAYSHFRLELVPAIVEPTHPALTRIEGARPFRLGEIGELALSAVDLRVLERLREEALLPGPALS